VKNKLTVTSVGLFKVALKDEKTASTTENKIWTPNVKHDLNTKSTWSFSLSLYFQLPAWYFLDVYLVAAQTT
jgi:hypothetical protein